MKPSVVVHVPHSSTVVPEDVASTILLTSRELEAELLAMTDWYTDELFALAPAVATTVRFPVSRLVLDPERFADDSQELMATRGMGVVYTRTSDGRPLRPEPTSTVRAELLARFYEPHHRDLTAAVSAALAARGACLMVDAHSFPAKPLPYEFDQQTDRPDICIGTDPHNTPSWLRDLAVAEFEREGFSVAVDHPFAGALVPLAFQARDSRVAAFMVELNRSLYMDERTGKRLGGFAEFGRRAVGAVQRVIDGWSKR